MLPLKDTSKPCLGHKTIDIQITPAQKHLMVTGLAVIKWSLQPLNLPVPIFLLMKPGYKSQPIHCTDTTSNESNYTQHLETTQGAVFPIRINSLAVCSMCPIYPLITHDLFILRITNFHNRKRLKYLHESHFSASTSAHQGGIIPMLGSLVHGRCHLRLTIEEVHMWNII